MSHTKNKKPKQKKEKEPKQKTKKPSKKKSKPTFPNLNKGSIRKQYKIGEEIGSGGFSIVVAAIHRETRDEVAIKIVDRKNTTSKEIRDEISVMHELRHPNIVNYREIFVRKNEFYVVLEKIDGGELFDRIIELQNYSEREASHVASQCFVALKHLHDLGYVHRDLKPENLLLSSRDANATIKLADFGFAVKMTEPLDEYVGTPPYMAPELIVLEDESHPGSYGKGVDVWALGVIIYILLSGLHPFQMESEDDMINAIVECDWEWVGDTWDVVSNSARELIMGMMEGDVHSRFTIDDCINHPWTHTASEEVLNVQDRIRKFQARKKLKAAIFSVIATQRLQRQLNALKALGASAPADEIPEVEDDAIDNHFTSSEEDTSTQQSN